MKKLRKITVTVFALAFVLLAAIPAFAENDSVADVINHSFKAYQILSAEGVDNAKLSKVAWGSALSTSAQQTSFLNALQMQNRPYKNNRLTARTHQESLLMVVAAPIRIISEIAIRQRPNGTVANEQSSIKSVVEQILFQSLMSIL